MALLTRVRAREAAPVPRGLPAWGRAGETWCSLYHISRVICNLKCPVGVWPIAGDRFPPFPTCAAHSAHLL